MKTAGVHIIYLLLFPFMVEAQNDPLSKIIDRQKQNSSNLHKTRGSNLKWLDDSNNYEKKIIKTQKYSYQGKQIAVLIFTHSKDSLNIALLSSKGLQYAKDIKYSRKNLERDVFNTNRYFSQLAFEEKLT
mgnify:CR=1 FL=1